MDAITLIQHTEEFGNVSVDELSEVIEGIIELLEPKINKSCLNIANYTTFRDLALPKAAFTHMAKDAVREAIKTYYIHKKWESNVPISKYINTILNRFSKNIINDVKCLDRRVAKFICPACKEFGNIEILEKVDNFFICKSCINQIELLENELNQMKKIER